MSAQGIGLLNLSVIALADIGAYVAIGYNGEKVVDTTTAVLGVTQQPAKAGESLNVCVIGTCAAMIATAGLPVGTGLIASAAGLVAANSEADVIIGYLLQVSGGTGSASEILIK